MPNSQKATKAPNNSQEKRKKSLSTADWEEAALDVIAHQGISQVAVEPLAKLLGVTKGSFYWHFSNRLDLLKAALKRWRASDREIIEREILSIDDPLKRLKAWFNLSAQPLRSHLIYSTLLADRQHPVVAKTLKEITVERLGHLQQAYRDLGYDPDRARKQALLAYSVYVGYLHMAKTLHGRLQDSEAIEEYAQYVAEQLMPALPDKNGSANS